MKKKHILLSGLLMLMSIGLAHAQSDDVVTPSGDDVLFTPSETVYTYIQQDGSVVAENGLATFDVSASPSVEFVDGKAVMTVNGNVVAKLPMSNKGELAVEFEKPTELSEVTENVVTVKVTSAGMGTFYSPFQLCLSEEQGEGVEVYAPTLDDENWVLVCNEDTRLQGLNYIPAGTGLLLKNEGEVYFDISERQPDDLTSALSGAAVKTRRSSIEIGDGEAIYTLGHENSTGVFGFFEYTKDYLNAGKAFLVAGKLNSADAKFIGLNYNDESTGIKNLNETLTGEGVRKYIENGHVVIVKDGNKFNANGQKLK